MKPALRPVGDDERAVPAPPKSLVDATKLDRLSFLRRCREDLARAIDAGVPAHALARLMSEADRVDRDIRVLEAQNEAESAGASSPVISDHFDASAI